jgi:multiple sugar transport system substrate-binding protein
VWDANYNTSAGASYTAVDKLFMAKFPGVTVKHVGQPAVDYEKVVQAAMTTKSGPDVLNLQTPFAIADYYQELVPLNDLLSADFKSQFAGWGGMNPKLDPNGQIYGIPYSFGASAFYYNKALFTKAGLDPNTFPTTYEGLVQTLGKLKAAGITPLGGGDKTGGATWWWLLIAVPSLMDLPSCYGLADGTTKWSDPRIKQAIQMHLDLIKAGYYASNYQELMVNDFSGFGNFINGQAAVVWAFPGYRPVLAKDDATNIGTAPGILSVGGKPAYFFNAGPVLGWTIPTFSKNKAAALEYIKFITSTESQQMHLDIDKVGPSNLNVDVSKADPDLAATFKLWKQNPGNENCARTWKSDVVTALVNDVAGVEAGVGTLDEALSKADELQATHS